MNWILMDGQHNCVASKNRTFWKRNHLIQKQKYIKIYEHSKHSMWQFLNPKIIRKWQTIKHTLHKIELYEEINERI